MEFELWKKLLEMKLNTLRLEEDICKWTLITSLNKINILKLKISIIMGTS